MRRLALFALLFLAPLAFGAELRLESDMDATADFDHDASLSFTTGGAGYCGEATIIDSDSDEAGWDLNGTLHCDSNGDGSFSECTAAGEQLKVVTIQFFYSADTNGDGTADASAPGFTATLFGRSQGAYTPYLYSNDGSDPRSVWRSVAGTVQHSLNTAVDPRNGSWWRVRYSYDDESATNKRKLCFKEMPSGTEYCDEESTTPITLFGSGGTGYWGFSIGADSDRFYGAVDEVQVYAGTYDYTFPTDGPGCASPCPDADSDGYADCTTDPTCDSSGLTCGDCDDSELYVNPLMTEYPSDGIDNDCDGTVDEDDSGTEAAAAPTWTTGSESPQGVSMALGSCDSTFSVCDICVDVTRADSGEVVYRNYTSPPCTRFSTFRRDLSESTSYGFTFDEKQEGADLEATMTCITDRGGPIGCAVELPSSAGTMFTEGMRDSGDDTNTSTTFPLFEDRFERPNTTNSANDVDDDQNLWTNCSPGIVFSQWPYISGGALTFDTDSRAQCDSATGLPVDQYVQARIKSDDTGTTNQDFFMRLRVNGTNDVNFYGCKHESGNIHFQKAYDTNDDGTITTSSPQEYAGACGLKAATHTPTSGGYVWFRCEVWTDPDDPSQVELRGYSASDTTCGGDPCPGTWTLDVTVQDGTTDTCGAWNFSGPNTAAGKVGIGAAKSGDHEYHLVQAGAVLGKGETQYNRRTP